MYIFYLKTKYLKQNKNSKLKLNNFNQILTPKYIIIYKNRT